MATVSPLLQVATTISCVLGFKFRGDKETCGKGFQDFQKQVGNTMESQAPFMPGSEVWNASHGSWTKGRYLSGR